MSESSLWMVIVLAVLVISVLVFIKVAVPGKPEFCMNCGHEGPGRSRTKGSILIEIVLWCLFLLPGLIYSIWRHTTTGLVCVRCSSDRLVPPDSPVARKMRAELSTTVK